MTTQTSYQQLYDAIRHYERALAHGSETVLWQEYVLDMSKHVDNVYDSPDATIPQHVADHWLQVYDWHAAGKGLTEITAMI